MKTQIVSFHCVLRNQLGQLISSSFNSDVINQHEEGSETLRGLVDGLQNVKKGEKRQILVAAGEAYGLYDPDLVVEVPRSELLRGKCLEVGSEVVTKSKEDGHPRIFRVITAAADSVVLDGNHPLAGQDLVFDIEVTSARDAKDEDMKSCNDHEFEPLLH